MWTTPGLTQVTEQLHSGRIKYGGLFTYIFIYLWRYTVYKKRDQIFWGVFHCSPPQLFVDDDVDGTALPACERVCFVGDARRFDLVANGGASLTLRYERAPFPTLHRTVWLPWNVFHVMDTVVMKREENDIPSCYLSGLIRPNPQVLATPLSTFYKTSPEDSPIVPETQVRIQPPAPQLLIFVFSFCFNWNSALRWNNISLIIFPFPCYFFFFQTHLSIPP